MLDRAELRKPEPLREARLPVHDDGRRVDRGAHVFEKVAQRDVVDAFGQAEEDDGRRRGFEFGGFTAARSRAARVTSAVAAVSTRVERVRVRWWVGSSVVVGSTVRVVVWRRLRLVRRVRAMIAVLVAGLRFTGQRRVDSADTLPETDLVLVASSLVLAFVVVPC